MIAGQLQKFIKDAIFISHSALSDYNTCPNYYFLKNIYKDKKTGFRLQVASPYLSLGSIVHEVIKWYLDGEKQFSETQVLQKYQNFWLKYQGKRGGFSSKEEEETFKLRGEKMLKNFLQNVDILKAPLKLPHFPKYILGDNLILIGNLDFIEELPDGSLHIIDFKTGQNDEKDPLQLYIYAILAEANLQKPVSKISYWYVDRDSNPKEAVLDPLEQHMEYLKQKAQDIKKAIEKKEWICKKSPELCFDCQDYQDILNGKGEFQYEDEFYKKMIYFLPKST